MNKSCPAFLFGRIALLLLLSGTLPLSLRAQVDSTNSSRGQVDSTRSSRDRVGSTNSAKVDADRRQNFWLSAGIAVVARGVAAAGGALVSIIHLYVSAD